MFTPKFRLISIVLAAFLIIASGVWFSSGDPLKAQPAEGAKDSKVKALLKQKLSILQEVALHKTIAYQGAQLSFTQVFEANQAVRNAELDLCETNNERVVVLEKMLAEAKDYQEKIAQQVNSGTVPTSAALKANVSRLDVEIALSRARGQ